MIFSEIYWKKELAHTYRCLVVYSKMPDRSYDFLERKVSNALILSAVLIRKLFAYIEESYNFGVEEKYEKLYRSTLLNMKIDTISFEYTSEEEMIYEHYFSALYSDGQKESLNIKVLCNQIIHSYVWNIVHDKGKICGFIVSSDKYKDKVAFYVDIYNWIDAIKACVEETRVADVL